MLSPIGILWEINLISSRKGDKEFWATDEQVPGVEFDKNFSRLVNLHKVSARLCAQTYFMMPPLATCKKFVDKFVHKLCGSGISQFKFA